MGLARAAPQPGLVPFRYATRQRFATGVPIQAGAAFVGGGAFFAELPRVGFLSHVLVQLTGTMTVAAGVALTTRGPWDLIRTLTLRTNIGAATIYSTTGYGNFVVQNHLTRGFRVDGSNNTPAADADVFAAPIVIGANAWVLTYLIPVAENYGRQSMLGLLNLQAQELTVTVEGRYGVAADVATGGAPAPAFTAGVLTIGYLYYELPDPEKGMYPPILWHRIIEDRQVITAVGDQRILIPREGEVMRLAHIVQQNDLRTNAVNSMTVRFNRTDELYRYDRWQLKWLQHHFYGAPLPVGVFVNEWWASEGYPGEGDNRDQVNSEELSTMEVIINTGGAVGGTLNAVDTIREFIQVVAL